MDERCMIFRGQPEEADTPGVEAEVASREESIRIARGFLDAALKDEGHREVYVDDALLWLGAR